MFNFSSKLKESLTRTRNSVFGQIAGLFGSNQITDALWDDLEALLRRTASGHTTSNPGSNCSGSVNAP